VTGSFVSTASRTHSASSSTPSVAVASVARLCSLLRAMCHSDSQLLLTGRQDSGTCTSQQYTRASGDLMAPQSAVKQLLPHGHARLASRAASPAPGMMHDSKSSDDRHAGTSQTDFTYIQTFNQASMQLFDAINIETSAQSQSISPMPQPHSSSSSSDVSYLSHREHRLQPISTIIAADSNWSFLIPTRLSRYIQTYRHVNPPQTGVKKSSTATSATAASANLQVWREIEWLQHSASPPSHAPFSTSPPSSSSLLSTPAHWCVSWFGRDLPTLTTLCYVRPIRLLAASNNIDQLLQPNVAATYEQDFEYIQEGFRFEDKDGIEILVYQILKLQTPGDVSSATPVRGLRWLCELRSITTEDALNAQQIKIHSYASAIQQFVHFSKTVPGATS